DPESASIADRIVRIRDGRVSEESARGAGAEESIVVGRGGWLRLPEELLRRSGIHSHAVARLDGREIVVSSATEEDVTPENPALAVAALLDTRVVAEARSLRKVYGSGPTARAAIDDLSSQFRSSALTAVTGPSGSGKTTLLHLLAGLELPTSGGAVVLDTELTKLDRAQRAQFRSDHVGYVGQQPGLVSALSALENVELALAFRDRPLDGAREAL